MRSGACAGSGREDTSAPAPRCTAPSPWPANQASSSWTASGDQPASSPISRRASRHPAASAQAASSTDHGNGREVTTIGPGASCVAADRRPARPSSSWRATSRDRSCEGPRATRSHRRRTVGSHTYAIAGDRRRWISPSWSVSGKRSRWAAIVSAAARSSWARIWRLAVATAAMALSRASGSVARTWSMRGRADSIAAWSPNEAATAEPYAAWKRRSRSLISSSASVGSARPAKPDGSPACHRSIAGMPRT